MNTPQVVGRRHQFGEDGETFSGFSIYIFLLDFLREDIYNSNLEYPPLLPQDHLLPVFITTVSCRHHRFLPVSSAGATRINTVGWGGIFSPRSWSSVCFVQAVQSSSGYCYIYLSSIKLDKNIYRVTGNRLHRLHRSVFITLSHALQNKRRIS